MTKATETATYTLEVAELPLVRLPLSEVTPRSQNPRIYSPEQTQDLQEAKNAYIKRTR